MITVRHRAAELFRGEPELPLGTHILEIGAGAGELAGHLYGLGMEVTALDNYKGRGGPEENYMRAMGRPIRVVHADFMEWKPPQRYDYVIAVNSLHHIVESGPEPLSWNAPASIKARRFFTQVRDALAPHGRVLIQEVSNRNYCPIPHYRRKMRTIRWDRKQPPYEWELAMKLAGLQNVGHRYRYPLNLPELPGLRPLLANRWMSKFMDSSYILTATRG